MKFVSEICTRKMYPHEIHAREPMRCTPIKYRSVEVVIYVALLKPCDGSILGFLNLNNVRCSD